MKSITALTTLALLALTNLAPAVQTMNGKGTRSATPRELAQVRAREERERQTEPVRDTVLLPARAVSTILRTPVIIGGTLTGKRELMDPMPKWRQEQLAEGRD